jgi:hypothetical protein
VTVIASSENMAWPEPRLSDRVWKAAGVFGVVLGWALEGWVLDHGVHLGPGGTVAVGFSYCSPQQLTDALRNV